MCARSFHFTAPHAQGEKKRPEALPPVRDLSGRRLQGLLENVWKNDNPENFQLGVLVRGWILVGLGASNLGVQRLVPYILYMSECGHWQTGSIRRWCKPSKCERNCRRATQRPTLDRVKYTSLLNKGSQVKDVNSDALYCFSRASQLSNFALRARMEPACCVTELLCVSRSSVAALRLCLSRASSAPCSLIRVSARHANATASTSIM